MGLIEKRQRHEIAAYFICFMLLVVASYGQSLGDVAREQRQKQQRKDARGAKKVITDEDLPAHGGSDTAKNDDSKKDKGTESAGASENPKNGKTAEQWKAQILAQKQLLAGMQKQAERLGASIHFVDANAYVNGPQYNQLQVRRQEKLHQLEQEIEEQKTKLEGMQESARQAGFGNAVYDPE